VCNHIAFQRARSRSGSSSSPLAVRVDRACRESVTLNHWLLPWIHAALDGYSPAPCGATSATPSLPGYTRCKYHRKSAVRTTGRCPLDEGFH
jgi:hypothetical protein